MSLVSIKTAIKTKLDGLVTDEVLGGATITDIRKNPLDADIGSYPHAFVMPPSIESEVEDNRTIIRTYTFDIPVIFNAENLQGTTDLEETIEAILSAFDNDPTLGGEALAGMLPVSSSPAPYQHGPKDLILVVFQVQAKHHVSLTFA